jgi:hypothetical protein
VCAYAIAETSGKGPEVEGKEGNEGLAISDVESFVGESSIGVVGFEKAGESKSELGGVWEMR